MPRTGEGCTVLLIVLGYATSVGTGNDFNASRTDKRRLHGVDAEALVCGLILLDKERKAE